MSQSHLALGSTRCAPLLSQAHLALGGYLLAIGGAAMILPPLLVVGYEQNDTDMLLLFLGSLALLVGIVLVAISVLHRRQWMKRRESVWRRTLLLAGPGTLLSILCPIVFGPRMWDVPPYGFNLVAASRVIGIGIVFAGSRFVPSVSLDASQKTLSATRSKPRSSLSVRLPGIRSAWLALLIPGGLPQAILD